ncbi:MAG: FAD:protein FMN transferase [Candidatus Cloacimonetes bacterium]|jgi:thiamine biosynthesis lipoprotein|nr:FAD:protein FMN transferase [Candidatus Cloacimonadota bacterium]
MTKKEIFSLIILIAVIAYGSYKFITREYTETRSKYLMDTIVQISASSKSKNVGNDIEAVFDFIKKLETKLDEFDPESMISQINSSEEENFEIDADIFALLKISQELYRLTDGSFDPTIKPVWDLWGFNEVSPVVPDSLLIQEELKKVDFSKISFDESKLYKPKGMQLTFGAIAKGYIIDQALEYMQKRQINRGFIDCRSSMKFFGYKISPLIYVQHPRKADDSIASLRANNLSIGTSGDYQQYFEIDDVRYHHIIDAKTGYPVQNVFSVTVVSPEASWADGLATAFFTVAPAQAMELIKEFEDSYFVIYYEENGAIVSLKTEGIKKLDFSESI